MAIDEKKRLDIRQWFEEQMDDPELASAVMEAMPPLDYDQFATKTDVGNLGIELRSEMGDLRAELKGDIARLETRMSDVAQLVATTHVSKMKWMVTTQLMSFGATAALLTYLL